MDHGAPRLRGLPAGRRALVSFSRVTDPRTGVRLRVGAWWAPGGDGDGAEDAAGPDDGPAAAPGLGLDVERVDAPAFADPDALGEVGFSTAERAWAAARPRSERPAARARLWTRKEALVKAAGTGFTGDPADVAALHPPPGVVLLDVAAGLPDGLVGSVALRRA